MVSSRRLSSGGQSSGAAAAYLMASAFLVDEDPHRGGARANHVVDDDESCIFPSTGSLVSNVTAGPSPAKQYRRGGAGAGAALPSSPRRRSYNGPYMYELGRSPDASFDDSECGGSSVASTFTAGPSASVVGSFGYGASNAEFASSAYPSPSPRRRSLDYRRPRNIDDDLVSDLTTMSSPVLALESRNDAVTKPSKKSGRGRGAMKSLSRSFRSRSPGLRNGTKKPHTQNDETVSVDGRLESMQKKQHERRSRTRSPLRKVADSISSGIKKTAKKGKRRSRSEGAERRLGAAPSERPKILSSIASSVDPAECDDCDDDSVSMYSVGSYSVGSHSTAPCSVGASSVASAPVLRTSRRRESGSAGGMRRVGSSASLRSNVSLLPTLIQEEEGSDDPHQLLHTVRGKHSPLPSPVVAEQGESRQDSEDVVKSVERSARKSLLKKAKNGTKNLRRGRSRSRDAKRRAGGGQVQCSDSVSAASDFSAPARIEGVVLGRPDRIKVPSASMAPPSKILKVSSSAYAATPAALTGRMTSEAIMAKLQAGSGAADAIRKLREQQSGLTRRSLSSGLKSKLSYTYIAGIPVPDYASYVETAVGAFRQSIGVSDEVYAATKESLLGWRYHGMEV